MEIDQTIPANILTPESVYFGTHKVECDNIILYTTGLKFNKVAASCPEKSRFNITIPPTDIQQAWFSPDSSTLIVNTVPDSGVKICRALQINHNPKFPDENSPEGSVRVVVQLNRDSGESVQEKLSDYFSAFTNLDWNLERINSKRVTDLLAYLNTDSEQAQSEANSTKENDEQVIHCTSILTNSPKTYSSLPTTMFSPCRPSTPKTPTSLLRPKVQGQRPRSSETPSIIDIEIDDEDDTENQSNLNASGTSCDSDIILNYPPDENDNITIYKRDLACLDDGEFLTDTILGFYLKYIQKELIETSIANRTYMFSTFFYVKLTKSEKRREESALSVSLPDRYFNRVKNWTKNVDIFDKDFLIVPINKAFHWFLAIICYPRKAPDHDEILPIEIERNPKRPCILFLDSLQGANSRCRLAEPLRHFLSKEWEFKKKTKKNFSKHVIPDYYLKVPKQNNHSDCGLFVLQYVESFLRNPDYLLQAVCGDGTLDGWFNRSLVCAKRRSIKRLIRKLQEEEEKKKNSIKMEEDS